MEEIEKQGVKKKVKWQIIIPIILVLIIVGIFVYVDYKNRPKEQPKPNEEEQSSIYKPQPLSPSENPKRAIPLDPEKVSRYGCAGPLQLEAKTLKQPDAVWEIKNDGSTTVASLGKYRITAPQNTVFDIKKLWLYFFSEKLSTRDDKILPLESSYVFRMRLIVNGYEKEIKLGGDEYMLIELDYPLSDLYPYDRATTLEYEILIDFKCKDIRDKVCFDNSGKPLDYLNDVSVQSDLRLFALGCQEFDKETVIDSVFKYKD